MKNKSTIIIHIVIIMLLISCNTSTLINGVYSDKNSHEFTFSSDSTYRYIYNGMWYKESSGNWSKIGNSLYLNSFDQVNKFPVKYKKKEGDKKGTIINIEIDTQDEQPTDYICFPIINGKAISPSIAKKGFYSIELDIPIESITFVVAKRPFILRGTGTRLGYDDVITDIIYPQLSVGEDINISIKIIDSLFGYRVFNQEKLKVKGRNIIFEEKNKRYKLHLKGN